MLGGPPDAAVPEASIRLRLRPRPRDRGDARLPAAEAGTPDSAEGTRPGADRYLERREPRRPGPAGQRLRPDRRGNRLVRPRRGAGGERRPARDRGDPLEAAGALRPALLGRVGEPGAAGLPLRLAQGDEAEGGGPALDPAERAFRDQAPGHDDGVPRLRPRPVPRQLRRGLLSLLAAERPPLLRLRRPDRHRPPDARDLRGRVVGRPQAPRRSLLRPGGRAARRLQPPEADARRCDLRRARRARPPRAAAHLADRVGDRVRLVLRPDRVLPGPDANPLHRREQRLRLRRCPLPGPLAATPRLPVPELHALPHVRPPPAVGGIPDGVGRGPRSSTRRNEAVTQKLRRRYTGREPSAP